MQSCLPWRAHRSRSPSRQLLEYPTYTPSMPRVIRSSPHLQFQPRAFRLSSPVLPSCKGSRLPEVDQVPPAVVSDRIRAFSQPRQRTMVPSYDGGIPMLEQRLPGRQGGQRYGGSPLMVQRAWLRGEVARFDGDVARGRAVAVPVGQSVYLISYRKTGGTVAQSGYDARDLVGRDRRSTRLARAVNPGGRPLKLRGGKTRGAHFEQYVPDSGRGWEDALVVDKALRAAPRLRTQRLHRPSSLGGGFVHHSFSFHMSLASSTLRAKVVSTLGGQQERPNHLYLFRPFYGAGSHDFFTAA